MSFRAFAKCLSAVAHISGLVRELKRSNTMRRGMTRTALVRSLAEQTQLTNSQTAALLEQLAQLAMKETKTNGEFTIPGVGMLVKAERKARLGRNAQTGETIKIKARTVVKFRVAKIVKEAIAPGRTVETTRVSRLSEHVQRPAENGLQPTDGGLREDRNYNGSEITSLSGIGDDSQRLPKIGFPPSTSTLIDNLPFRLLPPGVRIDTEQIKSHIRRQYPGETPPDVDWNRYLLLKSALDANLIALGKDSWRGYGVYKFPKSPRVLIDCVVTGNAAYVLEGDWTVMIHLTKADIRSEYRHERVFHTGDWIARVASSLVAPPATFGNRFFSRRRRLQRSRY